MMMYHCALPNARGLLTDTELCSVYDAQGGRAGFRLRPGRFQLVASDHLLQCGLSLPSHCS